MSPADRELESLRDLIAQVADEDAAQLVAEARAEARNRVRAALIETMTGELAEAVGRRLAPGASGPVPQPLPPELGPQRPEGDVPISALGTYVYGVVWATDAALTDNLSGLDADCPVSTVIQGPLAAVVSRVPLAEFEEDELRSHLSDLDWVERVARAHEAVLDDLCARTVVVPMRMCTVFRTEENLLAMLEREEVGIRSALEFLDGKLEWGLKVFARGASEVRASPDTGAEDARAASSGADYLARRRARRDEQAELEAIQAEAAAEIHEALGEVAHDGQLNPIQNDELPDRQGRLVMNGVYLVGRDSSEAFHQEVEDLEQRFASLGLELLRTGPWPPYNFVPGDVGATW